MPKNKPRHAAGFVLLAADADQVDISVKMFFSQLSA